RGRFRTPTPISETDRAGGKHGRIAEENLEMAAPGALPATPGDDRRVYVEDAFARHAADLRRLALGRLGDLQAAEDIVQETFLRALTTPRLDIDRPLWPW